MLLSHVLVTLIYLAGPLGSCLANQGKVLCNSVVPYISTVGCIFVVLGMYTYF